MPKLRKKSFNSLQFVWLRNVLLAFHLVSLTSNLSIFANEPEDLSENFAFNAQENFENNSSEIYRLHSKIFSRDKNSLKGTYYTKLIAKFGIGNLLQILTALEGFIEDRPTQDISINNNLVLSSKDFLHDFHKYKYNFEIFKIQMKLLPISKPPNFNTAFNEGILYSFYTVLSFPLKFLNEMDIIINNGSGIYDSKQHGQVMIILIKDIWSAFSEFEKDFRVPNDCSLVEHLSLQFEQELKFNAQTKYQEVDPQVSEGWELFFTLLKKSQDIRNEFNDPKNIYNCAANKYCYYDLSQKIEKIVLENLQIKNTSLVQLLKKIVYFTNDRIIYFIKNYRTFSEDKTTAAIFCSDYLNALVRAL